MVAGDAGIMVDGIDRIERKQEGVAVWVGNSRITGWGSLGAVILAGRGSSRIVVFGGDNICRLGVDPAIFDGTVI